MKPREFHIWDLPLDKISVKMEDKFRAELFNVIKKEIGGVDRFTRFFDYNRGSFSEWKLGKRFILLSMLFRMSNALVEMGYEKFNEKEIEKHIEYLKSVGAPNNKAIHRPNLPIKIDKRLVRLIAHMLADGYEGTSHGNYNKRGSYCNTRKELIKDFKNCLTLFGKVPTNIWRNNFKKADTIFFPAVVTYILKHICNTNTFLTKESEIPEIVFQTPAKLMYNFLGAFIDDEFAVYDSSIRLTCANKKLTEGVKELFETLDFDTSEIKNDREYYMITIYDMNKIENIPIIHKKKRDTISFSLNRKNNKSGKWGETKGKVLKALTKKIYTPKQLSRLSGIREQTMRRHLRELEHMNKIEHLKVNNINYWKLRKQ